MQRKHHKSFVNTLEPAWERKWSRLTVRQPKNDFWCTVEPGDQIRGDLVGTSEHCASEIADLDDVVALVDQDIVGLDVCMEDAALLHEMESHKHLRSHGPHRIQPQADALAILLGQLPKI